MAAIAGSSCEEESSSDDDAVLAKSDVADAARARRNKAALAREARRLAASIAEAGRRPDGSVSNAYQPRWTAAVGATADPEASAAARAAAAKTLAADVAASFKPAYGVCPPCLDMVSAPCVPGGHAPFALPGKATPLLRGAPEILSYKAAMSRWPHVTQLVTMAPPRKMEGFLDVDPTEKLKKMTQPKEDSDDDEPCCASMLCKRNVAKAEKAKKKEKEGTAKGPKSPEHGTAAAAAAAAGGEAAGGGAGRGRARSHYVDAPAAAWSMVAHL